MNSKNKVDLFLDSGAYSAMTQGVEIDIQEYIEFIKKHKEAIEVYANLDVITGMNGQPDLLTAEKTLENQKIMEKAGLRPLPVFHAGEPMEYLQYYVDNYDYVAIGGLVTATAYGHTWFSVLDQCFTNVICSPDGMPKIKVHGFGITGLNALLRYPWYSVDSSSWVATSRFGSIFIPRYKNGEWIYDEASWTIAVSAKNPKTKEAGQHITTLSRKQQEILLKYIHEKGYTLGKSRFEKVSQEHELKENEKWAEKKPKDKYALREIEIIEEPGVCNIYKLRDEMNIIYFQDLEKALPEWPWPFKCKKLKGFDLV